MHFSNRITTHYIKPEIASLLRKSVNEKARMAFNPVYQKNQSKIKKAKHKSDHVYTSLFMVFKSNERKIIIMGIAYIGHGIASIAKTKSAPSWRFIYTAWCIERKSKAILVAIWHSYCGKKKMQVGGPTAGHTHRWWALTAQTSLRSSTNRPKGGSVQPPCKATAGTTPSHLHSRTPTAGTAPTGRALRPTRIPPRVAVQPSTTATGHPSRCRALTAWTARRQPRPSPATS